MGGADATLYARWDWAAYEVGDPGPTGGWIFHVNDDAAVDGWRYLEAAPVEAEVRGEWGAWGASIAGLTNGIGDGLPNTGVIVTWLAVHEPENTAAAAVYADGLVYGGADDWFLPSLYEGRF